MNTKVAVRVEKVVVRSAKVGRLLLRKSVFLGRYFRGAKGDHHKFTAYPRACVGSQSDPRQTD